MNQPTGMNTHMQTLNVNNQNLACVYQNGHLDNAQFNQQTSCQMNNNQQRHPTYRSHKTLFVVQGSKGNTLYRWNAAPQTPAQMPDPGNTGQTFQGQTRLMRQQSVASTPQEAIVQQCYVNILPQSQAPSPPPYPRAASIAHNIQAAATQCHKPKKPLNAVDRYRQYLLQNKNSPDVISFHKKMIQTFCSNPKSQRPATSQVVATNPTIFTHSYNSNSKATYQQNLDVYTPQLNPAATKKSYQTNPDHSSITWSNISHNQTPLQTQNNSTITGSYVSHSQNPFQTQNNSTITGSYVSHSQNPFQTQNNSTITGSNISHSQDLFQTHNNSTITGSNISHSQDLFQTQNNSTITGSNISHSQDLFQTQNNSTIPGSNISHSQDLFQTQNNSTITGSNISHNQDLFQTQNNSTITGSNIYRSQNLFQTQNNSTIIGSNIYRSQNLFQTQNNSTIIGSNISHSQDLFQTQNNSTITGSNISHSQNSFQILKKSTELSEMPYNTTPASLTSRVVAVVQPMLVVDHPPTADSPEFDQIKNRRHDLIPEESQVEKSKSVVTEDLVGWERTKDVDTLVSTEDKLASEVKDSMDKDKMLNLGLLNTPTQTWTVTALEKLLANTFEERTKRAEIPSILEQIINLYWGGSYLSLVEYLRERNIQNLSEEILEFCSQHLKPDTVICRHLDSHYLTQPERFHVLKENEAYTEPQYTSSWLNMNADLDDIDKEFGFPPNCFKVNKEQTKTTESSNYLVNAPSENKESSTDEMGCSTTGETDHADVVDQPDNGHLEESAGCMDNDDPFSSLCIEVLSPSMAKAIHNGTTAEDTEQVKSNEEVVEHQQPNWTEEIVDTSEEMEVQPIEQICCLEKWKQLFKCSDESKCTCDCKSPKENTKEGKENINEAKQMDGCFELIEWPDIEELFDISDTIDISDDDYHFPTQEAEKKSLPEAGTMMDVTNNEVPLTDSHSGEVKITSVVGGVAEFLDQISTTRSSQEETPSNALQDKEKPSTPHKEVGMPEMQCFQVNPEEAEATQRSSPSDLPSKKQIEFGFLPKHWFQVPVEETEDLEIPSPGDVQEKKTPPASPASECNEQSSKKRKRNDLDENDSFMNKSKKSMTLKLLSRRVQKISRLRKEDAQEQVVNNSVQLVLYGSQSEERNSMKRLTLSGNINIEKPPNVLLVKSPKSKVKKSSKKRQSDISHSERNLKKGEKRLKKQKNILRHNKDTNDCLPNRNYSQKQSPVIDSNMQEQVPNKECKEDTSEHKKHGKKKAVDFSSLESGLKRVEERLKKLKKKAALSNSHMLKCSVLTKSSSFNDGSSTRMDKACRGSKPKKQEKRVTLTVEKKKGSWSLENKKTKSSATSKQNPFIMH